MMDFFTCIDNQNTLVSQPDSPKTINQGGHMSYYSTHDADKQIIITELCDLLEDIPEKEIPDILTQMQMKLQSRASDRGASRCSKVPNDPYEFERHLISKAYEYISAGDPLKAYHDSLCEHNHGHSGFVDNSRQVYMCPKNEQEKRVSKEMREMIISVIRALFTSEPLTQEKGVFGDGWYSVVAIYECLALLGTNLPAEMVQDFKNLLSEYKKLDADNREVDQIERLSKIRFGK